MNFNIDKFIALITPFIVIWVVLYSLSTVLFFILPQKSVEYLPSQKVLIDYKNYDMSALFLQDKPKVKKSVTANIKSLPLLSGFELLAIYAQKDGMGWITVKDKEQQKTVTLKTGESFRGYRLKQLFSYYALFESQGREYKLQMQKPKNKFEIIKQDDSQAWKEKIMIDGNTIQIRRKFIDSYVSDFSKAWKSAEVKMEKNGYLLTNIGKDSLLLSLGLKQNDIINKINGLSLQNYEDVFKIYKKIKSMNRLDITIYRQNKLVELTYEIN